VRYRGKYQRIIRVKHTVMKPKIVRRGALITHNIRHAPRHRSDWTTTTMYIPQDIANLIVDQIISISKLHYYEYRECLQATSLVSTVWVNPSQRRLFSVVEFRSKAYLQKWYYGIKPGPHGISRHVRVLRLWGPIPYIPKFALPHLTSFQNLRVLDIGNSTYNYIGTAHVASLIPTFASYASTLKRLRWKQGDTDTHETC